MYTVHLHQLEFYAYHGLHEEEAIIGNKFEVSVDIHFHQRNPITAISQTINYVSVYDVLREEMKVTEKLLETLCDRICSKIYLLDNRIASIDITIYKSSAPIHSFTGKVGVSFKKLFSL